MSYRAEEIERRLRSGEDSGWEFKQVVFSGDKPTGPTRNDWADEIAAFANADGGVLQVRIVDILGRSALVEYFPMPGQRHG